MPDRISTIRKLLLSLFLSIAAVTTILPAAMALAPNRLLSQCRQDIWGPRDGLPLLEISSLAQTSDGYIWIGTSDGLYRFDGSVFDRFDTSNTPGLTSAAISALSTDSRGRLWIGTARSGFGVLDHGRFIQLCPKQPGWNVTTAFAAEPDGGMWIGGNLNKSFFYAPPAASSDPRLVRTLPGGDDEIDGIVPRPNGSLIVAAANSGLMDFSLKGGLTQNPYEPKFPSMLLNCVLGTPDGSLWCGTDHTGLIRIKNGVVQDLTRQEGLSSNTVQCLCADQRDRVWIGTANGISYCDRGRIFQYTRADGLPNSNVHALLVDREGNLWVGDGTQLVRFADTALIPYTLTAGSSLVRMAAACPSGDGGLWCATNSGLWRLHRGTAMPFEHQASWPGGEVRGILKGDHDTVWTWSGSGTYTLDCFDNSPSGVATHLKQVHVTVTRVYARVFAAIDDVFEIADDLDWYEAQPGKPLITHPANFGFIFNMERDPRNTLWLGSVNGLFRLADHRIVPIEGMPAGTKVIGIDAGVADDILFVTETQLGRYHDGTVHLYGEADGFPRCHPFQVSRDLQGNIWVGADSGIYRLAKGELEKHDTAPNQPLAVTTYQTSDGIESTPANLISSRRTADGAIWFVGTSGATLVDPSDDVTSPPAPPVVIQDTILDKTPILPGLASHVPPGPGDLAVRFADLSYAAPEQIRFRYRLVGLNQSWKETSLGHVATYNSLGPGHYRFEVTARDGDGSWNPQIASVSFDLQPHLYQTLWFKIACLVLGIAAVGAIVMARTARIERQKQRLEAEVAQRTSELLRANAELQTTKDELETQNEELLVIQEELADANQQLTTLATTDSLTGLKNRRVFEERLQEEWNRRSRTSAPLSVIMLDIDHFKGINDMFGHAVGDEVLQGVAQVLAANTRPFDLIARYGGEEMVIVAPETDARSAFTLAERLRATLAGKRWSCGQVTASFGVSTWQPDMTCASSLTADADAALYISKQQGRNRVSHTGSATFLSVLLPRM